MKLLFITLNFFISAVFTELIQSIFDKRIFRRISKACSLSDFFTVKLSVFLYSSRLRLKRIEHVIKNEMEK